MPILSTNAESRNNYKANNKKYLEYVKEYVNMIKNNVILLSKMIKIVCDKKSISDSDKRNFYNILNNFNSNIIKYANYAGIYVHMDNKKMQMHHTADKINPHLKYSDICDLMNIANIRSLELKDFVLDLNKECDRLKSIISESKDKFDTAIDQYNNSNDTVIEKVKSDKDFDRMNDICVYLITDIESYIKAANKLIDKLSVNKKYIKESSIFESANII